MKYGMIIIIISDIMCFILSDISRITIVVIIGVIGVVILIFLYIGC